LNYLTDLTKEEIKYVCTVIPFKEVSAYFRRYPKEFSKLKPGFRVKSLNEDTVIRTLYDFRNRDFIASFLIKHIDRWIEKIDEELEKALGNGLDQEAAYIDVLSRSFFSGNVALFFKIKGEDKSEDYLKVMCSSVFYQSAHQKANEEELDFLKKRQRKLIDIQEELKNQISDEEKIAKELRKKEAELKKELKEKIIQIEQKQEKITRLSEKVDKMETELKKAQDDEVWKTAEMQQKIDTLTSKLKDQSEKATGYETSISEYASRLSTAEDDIETWKNKVRSHEKQLFTYKAERATFLKDQESDRKQIRELKEALDKALGVEKVYKECLSVFSIEKEFYPQKNKELEETLEAQKNIETTVEAVSKRYANTDWKMPLCPEDMDDFDEYFSYNLENIGFDKNEDGSSDFVDYLEKSFFCGIPLLIKRGPGINLANCLANTIYGVPVAAYLLYSEGAGLQKIREFLANAPDRVICIDGFIGNCNELELIPVLEQYRNKIIILTYMYDKTLSFVPYEILSSVHFISADVFSSVLRIRDITEDPSEVKEISSAYKSNTKADRRSQKIFYEIACECGLGMDTAYVMADMIEDENYLNEMLMFTLLPYVSKVLGKNPYNCSKRLQRYAGEAGRCSKKDILMRWFG
jgi:hypothetical protein